MVCDYFACTVDCHLHETQRVTILLPKGSWETPNSIQFIKPKHHSLNLWHWTTCKSKCDAWRLKNWENGLPNLSIGWHHGSKQRLTRQKHSNWKNFNTLSKSIMPEHMEAKNRCWSFKKGTPQSNGNETFWKSMQIYPCLLHNAIVMIDNCAIVMNSFQHARPM